MLTYHDDDIDPQSPSLTNEGRHPGVEAGNDTREKAGHVDDAERVRTRLAKVLSPLVEDVDQA